MIVVHVHRTAWPILGGAEKAMQKICEELVKLGHEVHVITSAYGADDRPKHEVINGVNIYRVKSWMLFFPDLSIPREIPIDILKKADVVHCWSQNSYFTYRICREAKKLGKPIVTYFLGVDYLKHHYNPLIRLLGYPYQKWITQKVVRITDLALTTNEYEKQLLKERYNIDAIVLPHGIDEMYLRMSNMAEHFRKKYGVDGKIVAYIGRIHPTKGLDLLIKAFAEVIKQIPDAILVIAGRGDEKYLEKCFRLAERLGIRSRIRYLGYISEKDKIALIDASNVVVLPTRHAGESYPLLIDEVLSRGRYLVITRFGAASKRAEKLKLCKVVEPNTISLAKTIIETLYSNVHIRPNVLTWNDIVEKLLEIYEKLLINPTQLSRV